MNNNKSKNYPTVLCIGGSDPSGGAGIQADMKTATLCGAYAMGVITCLTAQNTSGFLCCDKVGEDILDKQLDAILSDIKPNSVKIGMLPDSASIYKVCAFIKKYELQNIVVDPILTATLDRNNIDSVKKIEAYINDLFPLADLVTPNIPELIKLLDGKVRIVDKVDNPRFYFDDLIQCRGLIKSKAILLKGGHSDNYILTDRYGEFDKQNSWFALYSSKVDTENLHGTGCMYSTAIASFLAQNYIMEEAVVKAHFVVNEAIKGGKGYKLGKGVYGPLNFQAINQK